MAAGQPRGHGASGGVGSGVSGGPARAVRHAARPGARTAAKPQATTLLVVSDLHLGDGDPRLENWRAGQQTAWEWLLRAAPRMARGGALELVINGDCFDFLQVAPPLSTRDETDAAVGVAKLERVIAAHGDWFAALRAFLAAPGRTVTFTTGNHDAELAFAPVRDRVRRATGARAGTVRFCRARAYHPLPQVAIEHGCQTDPWNRIYGLWDQPGMAVATPDALEVDAPGDTPVPGEPAALALPFGSCYQYQVYLPIQRRFPYFDAFVPALPQAGVVAMVCLLAPELVAEGIPHAARLFRQPEGVTVPALGAELRRDPARFYETVLPFVAALQADVWERAGVTAGPGEMERMIAYVMGILMGMAAGELEALRAIFAVPDMRQDGLPKEDADAAAELLLPGARARVGLVGHTHVAGAHPLPGADGDPAGPSESAARTIINTGTWYTQLARPRPDQVDERLAAWLRDPASGPAPVAPATTFSYALVRATAGGAVRAELRRVEVD